MIYRIFGTLIFILGLILAYHFLGLGQEKYQPMQYEDQPSGHNLRITR